MKKKVESTEKKSRKVVYFGTQKDEMGKPVLEVPTTFPIRGWLVAKGNKLKGIEPTEYMNRSAIVAAAREIKTDGNVYFFRAANLAYDEL